MKEKEFKSKDSEIKSARKKFSRRHFVGGVAGGIAGTFFGTCLSEAGGGGERGRMPDPRTIPQTEIDEVKMLSKKHMENIKKKAGTYINSSLQDQYELNFDPIDVDKILDDRSTNPYMHNNGLWDFFVSPNRGGYFSSKIFIGEKDSALQINTSSTYDESDHLIQTGFTAVIPRKIAIEERLPEIAEFLDVKNNRSYLPEESFQKATDLIFHFPNEIEWEEAITDKDNVVSKEGKTTIQSGDLIIIRVNSLGTLSFTIKERPEPVNPIFPFRF